MDTDKIYAEQIANEYAKKEASKVVALRKLDSKAKRPARIFGYTFGIISTLLLEVGMCLIMGKLGDGSTLYFIIGIGVGVLGLIGTGVNHPIYKRILAHGKKKFAFDIIELAKEITEK